MWEQIEPAATDLPYVLRSMGVARREVIEQKWSETYFFPLKGRYQYIKWIKLDSPKTAFFLQRTPTVIFCISPATKPVRQSEQYVLQISYCIRYFVVRNAVSQSCYTQLHSEVYGWVRLRLFSAWNASETLQEFLQYPDDLPYQCICHTSTFFSDCICCSWRSFCLPVRYTRNLLLLLQ